jgi:hypothetical protein
MASSGVYDRCTNQSGAAAPLRRRLHPDAGGNRVEGAASGSPPLEAAPGNAEPDNWQAWRWEFGDQPGHSPRYAVVRLPQELPNGRNAVRNGRAWSVNADSDGHPITLGWFHRYPARFAADVLSGVLAAALVKAERQVMTVLDPFCGTGAVLAASRQILRNSVGVELTTLGQWITQVRLDPPDPIVTALDTTLKLARVKPAEYSETAEELEEWIGPANARQLTSWIKQLAQIPDTRTRRFAQVAISQSLRPASRWLAGSVKPTTDPHREPRPIAELLPRFARQLAKDCSAELQTARAAAKIAGIPVPTATVVAGDGLQLPCADNSADMLITSPPYFVTYDYFDVQRLTYLAFGWPVTRALQLGSRYGHSPNGQHRPDLPPEFASWYNIFGCESSILGRALRVYGQGFMRHAREARRVIAPGGVVAYSAANTVRQGQLFDLVKAIAQILTAAGFSSVEIRPRPQAGRRILPPGRDTATGRFAGNTARAGIREYVVYGISS